METTARASLLIESTCTQVRNINILRADDGPLRDAV